MHDVLWLSAAAIRLHDFVLIHLPATEHRLALILVLIEGCG